MADKKISQLPAATTPLAGTEVLPIVQSGTTVKVSVDNLTAGKPVSCSNLTVTGTLTGSTGVMNIGSGQFYKDSSGNVGVGVTPSAWTVSAKAFQLLNYSSISELSSITHITNNGYINAGGNWIYQNSAPASNYYQYNGTHIWRTAATGTAGTTATFTQVMGIDTSGNITANTGNVVIGTSGKGIDFSATPQPAGMTSELLADYEEGTWTVTATPTTSGTITLSSATGAYTKIGNKVFVSGRLIIQSVASPVGGEVRISLPIAVTSGTVNASGGTITYYDSSATAYLSPVATATPDGGTYIRVFKPANEFDANDQITFELFYFA